MKLFREVVAYLGYYIGTGLVCAGYAAAWHDFIAAYHLSMDRGGNHENRHEKAKPRVYSGCFE